MIDEYAYNFLFPLSSIGSSGTSVSSRTNGQLDDFDSSYYSLSNLRKPEICAYKSILRNNDLNNCDYFQSSVSQPSNSQDTTNDIQNLRDSNICYSNADEINKEIKSTNTEPGFIVALSSFLTQIATSNSSNSSCNVGVLTPFHSVCIPPIPIRSYLIRLAQNFGCSNECFVLAIIYVGRIIKYNRNFTVTLLNVHRVIVTALILATKFFDDIYYSNAFYAKISGVGTRELNSLEIHFLRLIRFQLFVTEHEYEIHKCCIIKSAIPHSAIPSLPLSMFNKKAPDDLGNNGQSKDLNFIGERKRLPLQNSSPYNCNYPTIYNSFPHVKKPENRDTQSMLIAEYSLNNQGHPTSSLYARQLNSIFNSNTELSMNCDFCSKRPSEISINSELAPFPQCSQNDYSVFSEKWISQQYALNNPGSLNRKIQEKFDNTNKKRDLTKDDMFSYEVDVIPSTQSSKIGSDYLSVNLKHLPTHFNNRYANRQADNTECTYNNNLNSSSYSKTEIQPSNLSQHQIELSEIQVSNMHPEYKNVINPNNTLYSNDMGFYGSINTSDINVFSAANAITSSTVRLVNPTVNHYGQHIFLNPYSIRCTTGIDRRLLV
ncbi:cyclin [Cryptosporidium ubiquitum]|uniref:Cyclin n=1 Tax=Cryptosporidium ubiquitum TaxID=857276 RepID=A0A1J4ML55_9CRYT|nr:cyclin [Cryptosporidium ubiquitum]OII74918.1 cyclin [Cryptosporidium ubiquitum]